MCKGDTSEFQGSGTALTTSTSTTTATRNTATSRNTQQTSKQLEGLNQSTISSTNKHVVLNPLSPLGQAWSKIRQFVPFQSSNSAKS